MKIGQSYIDFEGLLIDGPMGCQSMEPKIMFLLKVLVDNAGQVMSRESLITAVWGVEYGGDERLSRGISILRKALGDKRGQHTHIATISRVGYRLIADVSQDDNAAMQRPPSPAFNAPSNESHSEVESNPSIATDNTDQSNNMLSFSIRPSIAIISAFMACLLIGFFFFSRTPADEGLSIQAKIDRGFSHIENFNPEGAIQEAQDIFSGILSETPNHAAARAGLALALFREHMNLEQDPALVQRAKAHAESAIRLDEHLAIANIAASWAARFDGDYARAHSYLDTADILNPNNILALEGRLLTFLSNGQTEKGFDVTNLAISIYPESPLFYSYRGLIFIAEDDFSSAEKAFKSALSKSPDNPKTYAQLAHSLYSQGRTNESVDVLQEGLKIRETALLYNNLGTYLFFQGQYNLAASAFEKTLSISGDTHNYLYWANLGDAYRWSEGKINESLTAYKRAIQLLQTNLDSNPDDANLKSRAAMFNAKLGNLDQARAYMDSFTLTPQSPAVQFYRAIVTYEILSDRDKALESLEAALKLDYPLIEILNDPEFIRLRQDPAYHKLLAEFKQ